MVHSRKTPLQSPSASYFRHAAESFPRRLCCNRCPAPRHDCSRPLPPQSARAGLAGHSPQDRAAAKARAVAAAEAAGRAEHGGGADARDEAEAMSSSGAVTLGEIADRLLMLEVACSRCDRSRSAERRQVDRTARGRYQATGAAGRIGRRLPGRGATAAIYERCAVLYPQLAALPR